MQEIRFSPPPKQNLEEDREKIAEEKRPSGAALGFFKFLFKILAVLALLAIVFWGSTKIDLLNDKNPNENAYSAVFLANGQVYFGKILENSKNEIVLSDVFYLQVNNNSGQLGSNSIQSGFNLIKMGNEIHGPTDKIFINKSQIVFYEYLREDSKVVESIKNYK